jgi:hypothetical protein
MTSNGLSATSATDHAIGPSGAVTVRFVDWDVELHAVEGDRVRITDSGGGALPDDLDVETTPTGITLRQQAGIGLGVASAQSRREARLVVELPEGAEVDVQTASSDVIATGLRGGQRFRTASGDLYLNEAAGQVNAEAVSGDIAIRAAGSVELALKTVSGDVAISGGRLERLAVATTSGDLMLASEFGAGPHTISTLSGDALVEADRGIRIAARTVAGDLSSELPHASEGGPGRRALVIGDGAISLEFRSVSGDLRVVGPGRLSFEFPPPPPAGAARDASIDPAEPDVAPDAAATPDAADGTRLDILRALERGEMDIAEASERLSSLDDPTDD